jgi:hypothetical protein
MRLNICSELRSTEIVFALVSATAQSNYEAKVEEEVR